MEHWILKSSAVVLVICMALLATTRCQDCPAGCSCDSTRQEILCNGITKLPASLPKNTKTLVVSNCNLGGAIDASYLTYLKSSDVEHLSIENCNISEIRSMAFYIFPTLKSLSLAINKLKVIELVSLVGLSGLQSLNLKNNEIGSLKVGSFVSMDQLTYLDVSGNKLTSLPNELFAPLESLKTLDLSKNKFETFPASFFKGLDAVTKLNASFNALANLPDNAFQRLPNIQTLDLRNNNLTSFPRFLYKNLTYLRTLVLDSNRMLHNSPGRFALYGLNQITTLSLRDNGLDNIELSTFHGMSGLVNLDLSLNKLTIIRNSVFTGVTSLQSLNLNENPIRNIENEAFKQLSSLVDLHLAKTDLKNLDGVVFNPLTNLIKLFLECNAFTAIPSNMNLPRLQYLHLENNKLTSYSNSFSYLKALRYLYLNNNQLQSFPNLSLSNFYHIEIRNNSISSLASSHFSSISNLRFLVLDDNEIQTLYEADVKSYFTKMSRISLGGNPFHCNCEIAWLKTISATKNNTDDVNALRCKTPHAKLLITETSDADLVCTMPKFIYSSTYVGNSVAQNTLVFNCTAEGDPAPSIQWENANLGNLGYHSCSSCSWYTSQAYPYRCYCTSSSQQSAFKFTTSSSGYSRKAPVDKTILINSRSFAISNTGSQSFGYRCVITNVKGTRKLTLLQENN